MKNILLSLLLVAGCASIDLDGTKPDRHGPESVGSGEKAPPQGDEPDAAVSYPDAAEPPPIDAGCQPDAARSCTCDTQCDCDQICEDGYCQSDRRGQEPCGDRCHIRY